MTLNRISGFVVLAIGLILLFWIIPLHTETVEEAWLRPSTLPDITAVVAIIASIFQIVFASGTVQFEARPALRAGLFFALSVLGLVLMHFLGFLVGAPVLVAVLMLLVGERRPLWLVAGIVLVPLAMWCSVVLLLGRPLP